MLNFPTAVVQEQLGYNGLDEDTEGLAQFPSSIGLHEKMKDSPKESWKCLNNVN